MIVRAFVLLAPVLLGLFAGRAGIFAQPETAIRNLNRYALYFGFPALVLVGILDGSFAIPSNWAFWVLVPMVLALALVVVRLFGGAHAGTMALVASFGNVAYLGLPVVEQALGPHLLGIGSLIVAMHVTLSMMFGPALLLRWSGKTGAFEWRKVIGQPLLWAPLIGMAARALSESQREPILQVLTPIGRSAAPVALFLLGLYLYTHGRELRRVRGHTIGHAAIRVVLMPGLTLAGVLLLRALGGEISTDQLRVFVLLAAMPAAITTFAIAEDLRVGAKAIAQTIVLTSAIAAATLSTTLWILFRLT